MPRRFLPALAATLLALCASLAVQAWTARPVHVPDGTPTLQSLSFNPVGRWGNPEREWRTTPEGLEADLRRISHLTRRVRLYTLDYGLDAVPAIAERMGMRVTLGVWVDAADPVRTRREMEAAVRLAREHPGTVDRVIVGNEVILREEMSVERLGALMDEMRRRTGLPVSTGEPTGIWGANPGLARHADYLAMHVLPYWGEEPPAGAVARGFREFDDMRRRFPGLPAEMAEFGWPSGRFNRGGATTSLLDQARVVREFSREAERRGVTYNVVEAFDQPWKTNEGAVGPHWGIFDASGRQKFAMDGPVPPDPAWAARASLGAALGLLLGLFWTMTRSRFRDALAVALLAQAAGAGAAWAAADMLERYWTPGILLSWAFGLPLLALLALVCFERLREAADVALRPLPPEPARLPPVPADPPMVSIHVPARSERAEVVEACLRSLSELDWPSFEVILVLNNTDDAALSGRLLRFAGALGPRFRMVHAPVLPGFKAGALNLALRETDPRASWVAVVDADYRVDRDWLRRAMALGADADLVQFPQEHEDDPSNPVRRGMNDEYAAFFDAGMVQRAMDGAIIVHGTMVAVRRAALERAGGWSEDHVCEDTEMGLRLLRSGARMAYSPVRAGRGILPDDMDAFRRQRDRWVYGGMRIAVAHRRALLLPGGGLTALQRYHFLSGWTGWVGDAFALLASLLMLGWAALMLFADFGEPPPIGLTAVIAIAALGAVAHTLFLHVARVRRGWAAAARATAVGMSLQAVVGLAVLRGLLVPGLPFRVTAKGGQGRALPARLRGVRFEAVLLALQWGVAAATAWDNAFLSVHAVWAMCVLLVLQSLPNLAAVALAVADRPWARPHGSRAGALQPRPEPA